MLSNRRTHRQTHRPSTVTLAAHARRGLTSTGCIGLPAAGDSTVQQCNILASGKCVTFCLYCVIFCLYCVISCLYCVIFCRYILSLLCYILSLLCYILSLQCYILSLHSVFTVLYSVFILSYTSLWTSRNCS